MRDIAAKAVPEDDFTVHPIESGSFSDNENMDGTDGQNRSSAQNFNNDDFLNQPLENNFFDEVANHNFDEVVKNNENEEVILSSNLLTDLAGAHDERGEKKFPIVFLVGLAIGVVLTYILLNK